jgi:signal transduction histidine kinase
MRPEMKWVSLSLNRLVHAVRSGNFWIIVALLAGITFLHYFSPQVRSIPLSPYSLERHAVERIAFLLPVAVAAFAFGQVGGLITLAVTLFMMLPRAILISPSPADSVLETAAVAIVGYFVVWAIETQAREKRLRQDLSQRLERAYSRLQTLYDSAQTANSTLELQQVLGRLVQSTAAAMGVRGCSIRLLDETGKRLNVTAVFGLSEAYVKKGDLVLDQNPLAREVLAGGVIAIGDVTTDGRLQYHAQAIAEGIRSMLSAPLLGKRGPLGLIRAYSTELNHFTEDDAAFLTAIASQGSIAIENAMAYQALGKLDQMKSRFVLTVTHELRSPVSVVRSLLRTLSAGYAGTIAEAQRDLIARALRRADFLQTLIDDLLDLAAGKSELRVSEERVTVRLGEAVEDVLRRFQILAEEKQTTLDWRGECGDHPIRVSATKEGVDRILNNLLSNAIKYTPPGGHVSVRLRRDDGNAHLEIADSGIGIPEEALPHLFEEFYRAPNAKSQEKEGTGLGLAITRDLVVRYGGRIDVQSKIGEGTTFTVVLPITGE